MMNDVSFFVLAGGYGKRTQPLSLVKPKPVFPLHGTPLLNILLRQLRKRGITNGFVNVHHLPDQVRNAAKEEKGLGITFFREKELSGSRILREAAPLMDEFLLVLNGDVFLEVETIPIETMRETLRRTGADGILLTRPNTQSIYSAILHTDDRFVGVAKHPGTDTIAQMYTGVAMFRKQVVDAIDETSFFKTLAASDFHIRTITYDGMWFDLGNPRLYFDSNELYKKRVLGIDASNSLSADVVIASTARVIGSIIWENTRIKGTVVLENCILTGGFTLESGGYKNKIIYSTDNGKTLNTTDIEF